MVKTPHSQRRAQGARVRSLVGELRFHMPHSEEKVKEKGLKTFVEMWTTDSVCTSRIRVVIKPERTSYW